ncbi:MAG: carboxymuconolactone decarboxylase family protein [Deltaproteobacteria bacterium]|nr:carboxymuconolactone decarboxylase family protein [Deltaproteobacteria bacterium]
MRKGLSEDDVEKVYNYENSDLPERTKMALRLTDRLFQDRYQIDDKFYKQLREHFDEEALIDLGMTVAFFMAWQRFIEAFGIRPDNWSGGMRFPWDPHGNSKSE